MNRAKTPTILLRLAVSEHRGALRNAEFSQSIEFVQLNLV